jgi:IS30 family transposase
MLSIKKGRSFLKGFERNTQNLTPVGAPFYTALSYRNPARKPHSVDRRRLARVLLILSGNRYAISIRERPAEIEDRAIPDHWEGDLLAGTKNSHIATLVERHSRFTMLVKVFRNATATVVALSQHICKLPVTLRRSLTWDRELEMAQHKSFTVDTEVKVYFCDPQSPWQRGTNENTNGLLRRYFPKRTDLSAYSQEELDAVALRLNQRPKKLWDFKPGR